MAQCSETSIQQKRLPTSVNNVVLFSVMETDPNSVKNVLLFFSYGCRLLNTFNYCMQWNHNPTKTSSHCSEKCGTFFSYGDKLLNTFNYCMQWNLNPTKQLPRQWIMWYFFQLWNQILFQWTMWYFFQLWRQITKTL